ncbi:MAG: DPP IV N-terminal domain-containing protein [Myxococcota bacterium]
MRALFLGLMWVLVVDARAATGAPRTDSESFLRQYAETRRFLSGRPVDARATPDGKEVLFLRAKARDVRQTLFAFDVASGQTRELLTPEAVLAGAQETLSSAEKARLERMRISARGFTSYGLSEDGERILVALSGRLYVVERRSGQVLALKTGEGAAIDPQFSPDGKSVAYVRDNDLHVLDLVQNCERRVTRGGTELRPNGLAEFVAQEEMGRYAGFWWAPDGQRLAYQASDQSQLERFTIADPMNPHGAPEAFPYPRPGKQNVEVRLGILAASGGKTTWVAWDTAKYPYLATVKWPKKGPLTVLVQNRPQTEEVLLAVDEKTGKTRPLLVERDEAWLNLDQDFPHWLEDGSGFFWLTERNGGPELELRGAEGALTESWVKPEAGFASFAGYDAKKGILYFNGGETPTTSQVWQVKRGEVPQRVVTGEELASETAHLSDDGSLLVIESTSVRHLPRLAVFKPEGTRVGELPSVAEEPLLSLNVEFKRVGAQQMHAAVFRPRQRASKKKLPVILQVYGGPGHLEAVSEMRRSLLLQWFADQGFVVVKLDGRGTPRRGRAWERAIKHDLATVPLADQVEGLKALAAQVPEMDMNRVGVYGWSFGGYLAALATLRRPDVFKAGVAGAPVVDWADYDTHYTERYLDTPQANASGYQKSSLLTYAKELRRPLLLIHGTADDNVYFFHTLKLSDALFREGKKHQVLPLSNFTHMVPDPLVTERLYGHIARFFQESL